MSSAGQSSHNRSSCSYQSSSSASSVTANPGSASAARRGSTMTSSSTVTKRRPAKRSNAWLSGLPYVASPAAPAPRSQAISRCAPGNSAQSVRSRPAFSVRPRCVTCRAREAAIAAPLASSFAGSRESSMTTQCRLAAPRASSPTALSSNRARSSGRSAVRITMPANGAGAASRTRPKRETSSGKDISKPRCAQRSISSRNAGRCSGGADNCRMARASCSASVRHPSHADSTAYSPEESSSAAPFWALRTWPR